MTTISNSCGSSKLKFEKIWNLMLSEDIRRKEFKGNFDFALLKKAKEELHNATKVMKDPNPYKGAI